MGLFKKRNHTKEELETMRSELRSLREHLEQTDAGRAQLAEQLGKLDAENTRLNTQVGSVESKVGSVEARVGEVAGSIAPAIDHAVRFVAEQTPNAAEVEGLRTDIVRLGGLTTKVEALDEAVARQAATPPPPPTVDTTQVDALAQQLVELSGALEQQRVQMADLAVVAIDAAERTDHTAQRLAGIADAEPVEPDPTDTTASPSAEERAAAAAEIERLSEKVAALDSRVNQVSLELTNQLTELSGDVDRAASPDDTQELIDRVTTQLDDLAGGQERLAVEQARYAIQFREDLADLADRLRRPR